MSNIKCTTLRFNIDKPLGWTSFAVVKKIRARLRDKLKQAA